MKTRIKSIIPLAARNHRGGFQPAFGTGHWFFSEKRPFRRSLSTRVTLLETIRRFIELSRDPVAIDPGDDPIPIRPDSFVLTDRGSSVTLECWSATRNLVRRVRSVKNERRGRLELEIERFPHAVGTLTLADLADPANRDTGRRGSRLKYRERFRRSLQRQFPHWRIAELSTDPDLHHTLSPSYPRAFLRRGTAGLAAIGAAGDSLSPDAALSFGLIWLDYLRRRETGLVVEGLAIFVPQSAAATTCHRVRWLNMDLASYSVFVHDPGGHEDPIDPAEYANFETRLDPFSTAPENPRFDVWAGRLSSIDGIERRDLSGGAVSLAVRGLEFARASGADLRFGIDQKQPATAANLDEIEQLARGLTRMRAPSAADRQNPLYTRHPEAWLESQVRREIEHIDATLHPAPIYGQVPQFAGGERTVIDLLAADRDARLTVIEVKAEEDIHLPLQALDYWMRVKWHLDRGEFAGRGYFPRIELSRRPPRLLLISPALDYHPSNEIVLRYISPRVETERIGVGVEWRQELRVMFRVTSPQHHGPRSLKPG